MKSIYLFVLGLISVSALAGDGYGSCYVENGVAHALFCSKTSDSASGTGRVVSFDRNGNELDSEMVIWIGIAVMGCDEVDTVDVEENAVGCTFHLSE